MTAYVDNAKIQFGNMRMCHLLADTEEELHAMAARIGVKRMHYQGNASTPHYDVSMSKRLLAIEAGAKQLNTKQAVVKVLRMLRAKREEKSQCE